MPSQSPRDASRKRSSAGGGGLLGRLLLPVLLSGVGCQLYDPSLLDSPSQRDGQRPMDAGGGGEGSTPAADAGDACVSGSEICNALDDDCDGVIDEETQAYCEQQLPNSRAVCGNSGCLNLGCYNGFVSCDGDPSNGCEPMCLCRPCPDAGSDDAGGEDAGGEDAGVLP